LDNGLFSGAKTGIAFGLPEFAVDEDFALCPFPLFDFSDKAFFLVINQMRGMTACSTNSNRT